MADENDIITRLARIEITQEHSDRRQEHTDKSLRDLNETTKKLVGVVHQLANQKDSIKRMHERQDDMEDKIAKASQINFEMATRINSVTDKLLSIEESLKDYKKMNDSIQTNSFVNKIIIFVVSSLFIGAIGIGTSLITGVLGG